MTEKRQTSQGYIIRILQHFATKLWNITNFVMLFQAVMKFLLRSKFSLLRKWSIEITSATFISHHEVFETLSNARSVLTKVFLLSVSKTTTQPFQHFG
jgi:valyl-tRNA synthetase